MANRECNEYEITINKLLKVVHQYTELVKIRVIVNTIHDEVKHNFWLTENASETLSEVNRLIKYYGGVPVWNIHIEYEDYCPYPREKGQFIQGAIVANCHYKDVREGYLREKEDMRKAKRREYEKKRRALKERNNE